MPEGKEDVVKQALALRVFIHFSKQVSHGHNQIPGGEEINPTTCLKGECQDAGE